LPKESKVGSRSSYVLSRELCAKHRDPSGFPYGKYANRIRVSYRSSYVCNSSLHKAYVLLACFHVSATVLSVNKYTIIGLKGTRG
jgi:hypothetical protein